MDQRRSSWVQAACRRFCKIYEVEIFFEDSIMEHPILLDVSQLLKDAIHCLQTLLKQMSAEGPQASRMSVDTGPFNFHYIIEGPVCYLTLTGSPEFLWQQQMCLIIFMQILNLSPCFSVMK